MQSYLFSNKMKQFFLILLLIGYCGLSFSQRPAMPSINSVEIDPASGKIAISWSVENTDNTEGFLIFRSIHDVAGINEGAYMPIIILEGNHHRSFIDTTTFYPLTPNERSEYYQVAAFRRDGDDYVNSIMSDPHNTLFASDIEFDECNKFIKMGWFHYRGWGEDNQKYEVYSKKDGETEFSIIGTVTDSIFVHQNIDYNTTYSYLIKAVNTTNNWTASSNIKTFFTEKPLPQVDAKIDNIDINDDQKIALKFTCTSDPLINNFLILRTNIEQNITDTVLINNSDSPPASFIDEEANVTVQYLYSLLVTDFCNNVIVDGGGAKNIVLNISADIIYPKIKISNWNELAISEKDVFEYKLFRLDNQYQKSEITTLLSGNDLNFDDNTNDLSSDELQLYSFGGQFCYVVDAYDKVGNYLSRSNIACIPASVNVFFPNAFNPYSDNEEDRVFKPVASTAKQYHLMIYNRWGAKIFESKNLSDGWDGSYNGKEAQEGVYTYYLKMIDEEDNLIEKTSQVLLFYIRR